MKNIKIPSAMYLFQEVEKLEMDFANHELMQLWEGLVNEWLA